MLIALMYTTIMKLCKSLTQRKTEIPRGSKTPAEVRMSSMIEPQTTKQSNLLNRDEK